MNYMENSFGKWYNDIPNNTLNTVIDFVVTCKTILSVTDDLNSLSKLLPQHANCRILDFGCGVGRNSIPLSKNKTNWTIIAYDNKNMLKQLECFCIEKYGHDIKTIPNLITSDNWDFIKSMSFDSTIAWLVFQHINEDYLRTYLNDIRKITKQLIINSRQFNDEIDQTSKVNKDTFAIIENTLGKPEKFIPDTNNKHIHGFFIYNFHTTI